MAYDVKFNFEDNRVEVLNAFEDAINAFLLEASAEIVAQTARRTPVDSGELKGSWAAVVDEADHIATVGSPLENAIWTELGTGEHALEGNGRKGGWWYQDKDTGEWHHTTGKKPVRMLHNAFVVSKAKIIRRAEQVLKGRMN